MTGEPLFADRRLSELERGMARLLRMPSDFTVTDTLTQVLALQVFTLLAVCVIGVALLWAVLR